MKPIITVVSGTYNRLPLLQAMVASCRASVPVGVPLDFVLVDGGSTDGTIDWCKSQPDVTLIEHGELLGAIRAFCDGAKVAAGKYVLLANDDVEILGDSLTRALIYLEETPFCGAVAFADDRPNPWVKGLHVWQMPAMKGGRDITVNYAQVGLFRRWLGEKVGWWGADDPAFTASTYAGDNLLSARIWEQGYTVDRIDGVAVHDLVHEDALRQINRGDPALSQIAHPDSQAYYKLYPIGPNVPDRPLVDNPDKAQLRILYLPIYEQDRANGAYTPRCQRQHEQKRGLRDALNRKGALVYEVDYLAYKDDKSRLYAGLNQVLEVFQPHMLLMQAHSADVVTDEFLVGVRQRCPRLFICNWNGDYWPEALTNTGMMNLLRFVDLQLVVNAGILPFYEQHGIAAAYWQIGPEEPEGDVLDAPAWDVLFLGSRYSEKRTALGEMLLSIEGIKLGLYGLDWGEAGQGDCTYDFRLAQALCRRAKITVADNQYPEASGFVSNRIFEGLNAGGALMLHQKVMDLRELTGITAGVHYIEWQTFDDLKQQIVYWLDPAHEKERRKIVKAAQRFIRANHTFDARINELFTHLLPIAKKQIRTRVNLRYLGRADSAGGVIGPVTGAHYIHEAGKLLVVDSLDAPHIVRLAGDVWQEVGTAAEDGVAAAVREMQ